MGNIRNDPGSYPLQPLHQKGGCGDPVNVKIPENSNGSAAEDGAHDCGHRLAHFGEQSGIVLQPLISGEEHLGIGRVNDTPVVEQLS